MLAASHLQRRDARTGVTLLAVQSALEAVRYQIVIMFLLAASTGLGTVAVVLLAYRRLFSRERQSLTARITQRSGAK
ncbi:hypothetical protein LMG19087_00507 [Ralstonia wenshanensis]|nr:hypothetical protein LMG19087_00507 [Ralstonia wenshanensis]